MNFFEHQAHARRRTSWLFALFSMVVVLLVWTVYSAVTLGLFAAEFFLTHEGWRDGWIIASFWQYDRFIWTALLTTLILFIGAAYKIHQLKQGGGVMVAEQLGGKRLPPHIQDMLHRRVLNVVEEMAIASGLPVPPVYILQESGVNAFAAGFTASDTVIGVTQGAVEMLNRDELQAVIAHEFSHILHGDSRINMRMVGLLHGMTLISDLGSSLLTGHISSHHYRKKKGSHPALWILGILLFLAGLLGMIAADLIKLAISRQREFLADASAVQFTRNPEAMAHALMTIGGYRQGSHLSHQNAASLGYFFFSHTSLKALQHPPKHKNWWASHPPLQQRIQRIMPSFRGRIPDVDVIQKQQRVRAEASVGIHYAMAANARVVLNKKAVLHAIGEMRAVSLQDV
ncbi:MAG: M48 family metallopeptidase, partial [Mariprofundaceae bacterium]|nr:M48 family metallopeptidase [Mariprofundaceae bacterium]